MMLGRLFSLWNRAFSLGEPFVHVFRGGPSWNRRVFLVTNPKMPAKTCPCPMGSFSLWTVTFFVSRKTWYGSGSEKWNISDFHPGFGDGGDFGWFSKQTMRPSFGILLRAFRFVRWGTWGQWTQGKDDCWSEIFDMWWSIDTDDGWNPVATKGCIMNVPSQKQTDPLKNRPSQRERGLTTTNFQGLC